MALPETIEVTIKNQDRRHVVDLLRDEIRQRLHQLEYRDCYSYGTRSKTLTLTTLPKRIQTEFNKLLDLDEIAMAARAKAELQKTKVESLLGSLGRIDVSENRDGKRRYVLLETTQATRERIEGNAEKRRQKIVALKDLNDRLLIAIADNTPIEPLIKELRTLKA